MKQIKQIKNKSAQKGIPVRHIGANTSNRHIKLTIIKILKIEIVARIDLVKTKLKLKFLR